MLLKEKCDVFCGSRAIAGIAGLMPLRYCAFVVISPALNFPSWVFCGPEIFFSWVFRDLDLQVVIFSVVGC